MSIGYNPYSGYNVKVSQQTRPPSPQRTQQSIMRSAKLGNVHSRGRGSMFKPIKPGNELAKGPDSLPIRPQHFQPNLVQAPRFN